MRAPRYEAPTRKSAACASGRCFDGVLLDELDADLANLPADRPTVLFYHMYGEHGPRYHEDSPAHAKVWTPECTDADLGACTKESIINAYDNAVRYTDGVLAGLVKRLKARTDIDAGFVYVSDHGESLGEGGLYLHGAPYFMAPSEQIRVPMVMWLSKDWSRTFGGLMRRILPASLRAASRTSTSTRPCSACSACSRRPDAPDGT